MLDALPQETNVLSRELVQVWKHRCQQVWIQSIPTGQSSSVLIDRRRRNPTTAIAAIVIRAVEGQSRIGAVDLSALNSPTHDKTVATPSEIGRASCRDRWAMS